MDNINGGDPNTQRKGNLMEYKWIIQTTRIMNGLKKSRERENPIKMASIRGQGMVKTQLEIV